jgi:hypothetical protein
MFPSPTRKSCGKQLPFVFIHDWQKPICHTCFFGAVRAKHVRVFVHLAIGKHGIQFLVDRHPFVDLFDPAAVWASPHKMLHASPPFFSHFSGRSSESRVFLLHGGSHKKHVHRCASVPLSTEMMPLGRQFGFMVSFSFSLFFFVCVPMLQEFAFLAPFAVVDGY